MKNAIKNIRRWWGLKRSKGMQNKFLKSARLMSIIWQISIIDAAIKTNGISLSFGNYHVNKTLKIDQKFMQIKLLHNSRDVCRCCMHSLIIVWVLLLFEFWFLNFVINTEFQLSLNFLSWKCKKTTHEKKQWAHKR